MALLLIIIRKKTNEEAKQTSSNDRYIISELDKETFKEVNYSNTYISSLQYENFIKNESLVAIDTNPILYLKDIREDMIKKSKDATLEISKYDKLSSDVDVRTYKMGKILSYKESFDNQSSRPNVTNSFGTAGQVVAKSRTVAQYNLDSIINVSHGEAWIIAHERNLSGNINDYSKARIDKVQSVWFFVKIVDLR